MIKIISKAYQVGNVAYTSIEAAQKAEIKSLFPSSTLVPEGADNVAEWVVNNKSRIMDILTTKSNSRPSRRKINKTAPVAQLEGATVS